MTSIEKAAAALELLPEEMREPAIAYLVEQAEKFRVLKSLIDEGVDGHRGRPSVRTGILGSFCGRQNAVNAKSNIASMKAGCPLAKGQGGPLANLLLSRGTQCSCRRETASKTIDRKIRATRTISVSWARTQYGFCRGLRSVVVADASDPLSDQRGPNQSCTHHRWQNGHRRRISAVIGNFFWLSSSRRQ